MLQPIKHIMRLAWRQGVGVDAFEFFFHLAGLGGGTCGAEEVHLLGEADGGGVAGFETFEDFPGAGEEAGGRPASLATWIP